MVMSGKNLSYSLVRKFVVNFYNLDLADFILYSAMQAPPDCLFLQSRRSEDWLLLDQNTTRHTINNASKYQWQLRFQMNGLVAAGASYLSG